MPANKRKRGDIELTDAELKRRIVFGAGVPISFQAQVREWYLKKRWKRIRVAVYMTRGGDVKIQAVSDKPIPGREAETRAVFDETMDVREQLRVVIRRAKAFGALRAPVGGP